MVRPLTFTCVLGPLRPLSFSPRAHRPGDDLGAWKSADGAEFVFVVPGFPVDLESVRSMVTDRIRREDGLEWIDSRELPWRFDLSAFRRQWQWLKNQTWFDGIHQGAMSVEPRVEGAALVFRVELPRAVA